MTDPFDLQRFVNAQAPVYQRVLGPPAPRRPPSMEATTRTSPARFSITATRT